MTMAVIAVAIISRWGLAIQHKKRDVNGPARDKVHCGSCGPQPAIKGG